MSTRPVADRSFVVRIDARSRSLETLPPPDPGTQVTLSVKLGLDPVVTEFYGNIISTPPGDNEYEIAMILTRKVGGSGLVYQEHGEFFLYMFVRPSLHNTDTCFSYRGPVHIRGPRGATCSNSELPPSSAIRWRWCEGPQLGQTAFARPRLPTQYGSIAIQWRP